jgi:hypothetical protein
MIEGFMTETPLQVTPGYGAGIDTFNVGTGPVGSGFEAIRQALVVADPIVKNRYQRVSPTACTFTDVAAANADTELLAINMLRAGATIWNYSTSTLNVYYADSGADATHWHYQMLTNDYVEIPFGYVGEVRGYWVNATPDGGAKVGEFS